MKLNCKTTSLLIFILTFVISGCSTVSSWLPDDDNVEYKHTIKKTQMDIPPDLTKPKSNSSMNVPDLAQDANTYSAYHGKKGATATSLPGQVGIKFRHQGPNSWLVLNGTKEQVWPRVREFWLRYGFVLVVDNLKFGILETEWSENRGNIPQGTIRKFFGSLIDAAYSSGTLDKFRMRIETGEEPNTVELFLSHRGMVEKLLGEGIYSEGSTWEAGPSDPDLEAKMLKRLMVDLGVQKQHATSIIAQGKKSPAKASLIENGDQVSLQLNQGFSRAWRLVGLALDRVSFTVVDRNRSKGIYYVRYSDPDRINKEKGFFSKLNFWSSDKKVDERLYLVQLKPQQETISVVINDEKGQAETSSTAERILKLLFGQLK